MENESGNPRAFLTRLFGEAGGRPLPFERFMEAALFDPDFGYYTANVGGIGGAPGTRGDFSTTPGLSKILARALARWVMAEATRLPGRPALIEAGPGEGTLMEGLLDGLGWWRRRGFAVHLVEISPRLRKRQQDRLRRFGFRRLHWHDRIEDALAAAGGEALVWSHELVDAFPVVALRWNAATGRWEEIHARFEPATGLSECFAPLSESRPRLEPGDFAALRPGAPWPDGQRVELHASYRAWLDRLSAGLRAGSLLTIDYGGSPADIYRKRPGGSLRAYFRNQRLTGPGIYRMFGRQDLTADVCFDDLRAWGEAAGFGTVACESQNDFLARMLGDPGPPRDRAEAFLREPGGAGEAFRALWQRKG
ncbi:MAG: SAM-dependent methyltransferase [Verrucomicrobiae bacterium]|nr:SAM-dependent methyltransferase [Verrucomicrobiae bacterium]